MRLRTLLCLCGAGVLAVGLAGCVYRDGHGGGGGRRDGYSGGDRRNGCGDRGTWDHGHDRGHDRGWGQDSGSGGWSNDRDARR